MAVGTSNQYSKSTTTTTKTNVEYYNSGYDFHTMTLKQAKELWNNPRSRQVITLSSGKVGVCEVGDPKGFPVVWFTGNMGPAFTILLYENFARRYHIRMLCVDRPGYNDTEDCYSKQGVPNVFEFVDMVNELTVFLGIYKFGLVTFSLGAVFGLAFSLRYPERLKGPLHLISPWVSTSTPGASTTMNDEENITISEGFSVSPGRSYLYNQVYQNGIWNLQSGKSGPHNDWMVALERVNWGYKYEDTNYPTRVFIGDMDEEVPLVAWKHMSERMKNVKFNVIEGAKHYLLYRMDFMDDLFKMLQKELL
ncbi:11725_t:CDS:2 [Ambispora leptoticha]|uniref:11725_t:CDS:1 n=1 Tax=Ambispora leptoticha TaxID=144679 RepID=A0A9N9G685_9GLOM|nr:11725_t:CDS:2 [Ambispora leptoticha]